MVASRFTSLGGRPVLGDAAALLVARAVRTDAVPSKAPVGRRS